MTYWFRIKGIEMTIFVECPFDPEQATLAIMERENATIEEVVQLGTIGPFIPHLFD